MASQVHADIIRKQGKNYVGMDKENFIGYEYENISTRILPYPLTTLRTDFYTDTVKE
jgi:hypothetical protein